MTPLWRTSHAPFGLKRSSTLPSSNWLLSPTLNLLGGSDRTLGNRKRTVPSNMPKMAALMAIMPTANQEIRNQRRSWPALAAGFGAAAGLGGGAAATGGVPAAFGVSDITCNVLRSQGEWREPVALALGNFLVAHRWMSTLFLGRRIPRTKGYRKGSANA